MAGQHEIQRDVMICCLMRHAANHEVLMSQFGGEREVLANLQARHRRCNWLERTPALRIRLRLHIKRVQVAHATAEEQMDHGNVTRLGCGSCRAHSQHLSVGQESECENRSCANKTSSIKPCHRVTSGHQWL